MSGDPEPRLHKFVAFLRGMNLGRRRITNDELCARFEQMGFPFAAAFLASGNVILGARENPPQEALERRIESHLRQALSWEVPTFVRAEARVLAIARYRPFTEAECAASKGKPQVALLSKAPSPAACRAVLDLSTPEDRLEIHESELYWLPDGGMSKSDLDLKRIESELGPMTIRTRNTVMRLAAKYFG